MKDTLLNRNSDFEVPDLCTEAAHIFKLILVVVFRASYFKHESI